MRLKSSAALLLVALPFALLAQNPKQSFEEALLQSRMQLVLSDGKFSGPGADLLAKAVQQSRFVLLGEDHITREIPQFAAALCDVMHPDAYAVETGPYAAQFVNALLKSPDRISQMAARMKQYPNNMAFLDIRQENDLAAHCAASSNNPNFALWGLDQEFLGAAGTLLAAMAATNPGPISRAAIAAAQKEEQVDAEKARQSGKFEDLYMMASSNADIQALSMAIDADGTAATHDLFHELAISRFIYLQNSEGSADSNLNRAELLKQHFLADYRPFQEQYPQARILFKFGDNHTGKGFSYTHQLDLGDFVAAVADGEQAHSLHMFVLGARGEMFNMPGYGKPLGKQPFVLKDMEDYKWLAPALDDMLPQPAPSAGSPLKAPSTTLTLYDLRTLRFRNLDLPHEWEHVIYSYDLCILLPELTVATPIQ
jgi:hypothetical protein